MGLSGKLSKDKSRFMINFATVDQDQHRQESDEMDKLKAFIKSNERLLAQFRSTLSDIDNHLQDKNRRGQNESHTN
jgi:hypothetical protein